MYEGEVCCYLSPSLVPLVLPRNSYLCFAVNTKEGEKAGQRTYHTGTQGGHRLYEGAYSLLCPVTEKAGRQIILTRTICEPVLEKHWADTSDLLFISRSCHSELLDLQRTHRGACGHITTQA